MGTFDQLSDEQRAIVELVLQQGKSYDELSELLGMPEGRVRELARDALVDLAPISAQGVEEDWRGQLADYVLGQQARPEATATRGHLRRSEAARSWTRSLLDSLEQLYRNGDVPGIPEGERGRARRSTVPTTEGAAAATAGEAIRRRRILAAGGVVALLLAGILVWPGGVLTGEDEGQGQANSNPGGSEPAGEIATRIQGQVSIIKQGRRLALLVQAVGLEPSTGNRGYQVWLYNGRSDRRALQVGAADQQGNLAIPAVLPADYRKYGFVDVTAVTVQGQSLKTGASVLRGEVQLLEEPVTAGKGDNRGTLLARFRLLPLPGSGG